MSNKALFLDRDGVINQDFGYVHRPEDTVFIPGIVELVNTANALDYKVIVVTNQAGIGRGYYTEDDFLSYMEWQKKWFKKHNAYIDAVYYCPHHPDHGIGQYRINCNCRKPKPGMINQAIADLNIDLTLSFLIGDKQSDVDCGAQAGVKNNFLLNTQKQLTGLFNDIIIKL